MKKNYFFAKAFAVAALVGIAGSANAQVFFTEDYEGTLGANGLPDAPNAFTETGLSTDGIWAVGNETAASSTYYTVTAGTGNFAFTNDDACNCDKSDDKMILPAQDFATASGGVGSIALSFDKFFNAEYGGIGTIEVSIDGGTLWTTAGTLTADAGWVNQVVDLGAYLNESNVLVAFKYNDDAGWAAGMNIDNVQLEATTCVTNTAVLALQSEYSQYPLTQVENIVAGATVNNLGADTVTNVNVTVNVYNAITAALEYTENSTAVASMIPGANGTFSFTTGFTPSAVGTYAVEYISTKDQADCVESNDTAYYFVQVSDSVYARDNADLGATLGTAGIGNGTGGELGQAYEIINDDTLTSIHVFISNNDGALNGQQLTINVYDIVGGQPTNILATTMTPVLDSATNKNSILDCPLTQSLPLGPGNFFVSVVETANSIQMGTTQNNYTNGPIMVNAAGITTGFVEQSTVYSGAFVFVLRPVFGTVTNSLVGIAESKEATFEVMPNPAVDNVMVRNIDAGNTVEVYNNLGQVVFSTIANAKNVNVNVSNFDNGIYTVKVIGATTSTSKFVKQ
ncbi:T9SS type A sorting domain-containing protein [Vicingus serpentipes]|uniref:T9SS type A sorting domain-containing protein n=1 Tax=Vicingus serpentipes TaxID=1926625 RepID=A0A5C6RMQ9_9FLAO|nr:T9SS type A sorting domain-containing protein [Vicingus serpentipes]TXB63688.1 T9SS type A sorting domain-containing protein [Vicingus serpentipes]